MKAEAGRTVKPRLLIIDDDPSIVVSLRASLTMEGYDVTGVCSGVEGLEQVTNHRPDLIILDIMMPGMDGRQVLRRLKSNPETSTIPVLMLTALGDASEVVRSLDRGAEWHLVKPFELNELILMVERLLELSREKKEE